MKMKEFSASWITFMLIYSLEIMNSRRIRLLSESIRKEREQFALIRKASAKALLSFNISAKFTSRGDGTTVKTSSSRC
jgi:hypothetical protein